MYESTTGDDNSKCEDEKMMSKRKWFTLLAVFILYILLGGYYFYTVENYEESKKKNNEENLRIILNDNLKKILEDTNTSESNAKQLYEYIENFCGKSVEEKDSRPLVWDYYHSVFFSVTVVTTIGYGNLAPTTSYSRIFMIFYALIGIPVNGIIFATLGEYFGKTFTRLYKKWKNNKVKNYAANLSLVSQIVLYLIPGLIIFLVLPAFLIQHFEKWDYVLSFYYSFVTLTTIGFGDYVAGVYNKGFDETYFLVYQIFLLIWIIFGLGYLVMVIGFLTRGLRSKKMVRLEKHITQNIKTTHSKLWNGFVKDFTYLRRILNEVYMARFKPIYRDEYSCTTPPKIGSQSFPDLRKLVLCDMSPTTARRRAFSECISRPLTRVQSDTDLSRIDKEATFANSGLIQPADLLANVATALTKSSFTDLYSESENDLHGIHGFSDAEILASELHGSGWTLESQDIPMQPPKKPRMRAVSEVKIPMNTKLVQLQHQESNPNVEWTWCGPAATKTMKELRQQNKFNRLRTKSGSHSNSSKSLFERIKHTLYNNKSEDESNNNKSYDIENQLNFATSSPSAQWENTIQSEKSTHSSNMDQRETYLNRTRDGRLSVFSVPETSRVLEETSVADLLRALTSIHSRVSSTSDPFFEPPPHRKLGTACLTPPKLPSLIELFNNNQQQQQQQSNSPGFINNSQNRMQQQQIRRASIATSSSTNPSLLRKRFSLHPVSEDQLMIPPPPYSASSQHTSTTIPTSINNSRRSSLYQVNKTTTTATSPVSIAATSSSHTHAPLPPSSNLVHKQITRLRGPINNRLLYARTRHNSLKDLNIEKPI